MVDIWNITNIVDAYIPYANYHAERQPKSLVNLYVNYYSIQSQVS